MSIFFLVIDLAPYTSESSDEFQNMGENTLSRKSITLIHHGEESDNFQVRIKDVRLDSLVGTW